MANEESFLHAGTAFYDSNSKSDLMTGPALIRNSSVVVVSINFLGNIFFPNINPLRAAPSERQAKDTFQTMMPVTGVS